MKQLKIIACLALLAACGAPETAPPRYADFLARKGQDVAGTCATSSGCWNGERESCTFGKCRTVCKDKDVKTEAGGYYCEASRVVRPGPVIVFPNPGHATR